MVIMHLNTLIKLPLQSINNKKLSNKLYLNFLLDKVCL